MAGLKNKFGFLLSLVLFSADSLALGVANEFLVTDVRADKSGKGYVKFAKPLIAEGELPSCSTHKNHLAFDANTPAGMSIMSLALAAQASGKPVVSQYMPKVMESVMFMVQLKVGIGEQ